MSGQLQLLPCFQLIGSVQFFILKYQKVRVVTRDRFVVIENGPDTIINYETTVKRGDEDNNERPAYHSKIIR